MDKVIDKIMEKPDRIKLSIDSKYSFTMPFHKEIEFSAFGKGDYAMIQSMVLSQIVIVDKEIRLILREINNT